MVFDSSLDAETPGQSEKVAHDMANEAFSIAIGVQMLSTIPKHALSPEQQRALSLIEASAERLVSCLLHLQELEAENDECAHRHC